MLSEEEAETIFGIEPEIKLRPDILEYIKTRLPNIAYKMLDKEETPQTNEDICPF